MEKVLYIVMGGIIMLFCSAIIHPFSKRLEAISRRFYGFEPISLHVERDPSVVWAGYPNWISAAVWLPSLPATEPPEHPTEWHEWARSVGGSDALVTYLRVTITCRESSSVVVNPPRIRCDSLPVGDPPKGVIAVSPTGGASVTPRRIQVNLDMGIARWIDDNGDPMEALSVALEPGESEQFFIFADASCGRYEWHMDLPLIVDGKGHVMRIDDDGSRFLMHGGEGLVEHFWVDEAWKPRDLV
ncbi:hypothetical protein [Streptomyces sp. NPDC059271]|uniref:hypothetical protein n=1 Tax=Streptomyces sp. NPDC059271 TaxID=3346799 RepID=UPI0036AB2982